MAGDGGTMGVEEMAEELPVGGGEICDTPPPLGDAPLSVLQRILLTTDGTVTHILEAYSGEAIEVVKLSQALDEASYAECAELGLTEHEKVLRRSILLRGRQSGVPLLHADSLIVVDRLELGVRSGLVMTSKPIGRLLRENRTETFREILTSWQDEAGPLAAEFGVDESAQMLCRTYHVVAAKQLMMVITERFLSSAFL